MTEGYKRAVVEEYGLHAGDKWICWDIGCLFMDSAQVSEACRRLTKTMLSVRALREDEEKEGADADVFVGQDAMRLVDMLAVSDDRSLVWPAYPDPATRFAVRPRPRRR